MKHRTRSREVALQYLYQVDITSSHTEDALSAFFDHFVDNHELIPYAREIVDGVCEHLVQIDALIEKASENWKVSRMSTTDRNILRIATYELAFRDDVPYRVVINEAIEIAKRFGSSKFPSFANGVLDRVWSGIAKDGPTQG
ncbi:MAG TPA: transcription antitermination factor NusB [Deltaproteobacteria bacterium]|nr:transcription antitermination factor NusB [Deltaproteobacteria bacterium]HQI80991.1 transcription antitermination factor NusB [Deltaproteobacteria bacterium]